MSSFDSTVIDEIHSRINLVELIGQHVQLRQAGQSWIGPCPFHQETKPSFSVNPDKGFYYCFGCQASGDAITFYKEMHGLSFPEAVEQLAEITGVRLTRSRGGSQRSRGEKSIMLEIHSLAKQFFQKQLTSQKGSLAISYLKEKRNLSPELIQNFGLGWAVDDWRELLNYLSSKNFSLQRLVQSGLIAQNDKGNSYDRFRARVIFPIFNMSGQVIAFGGRVLDDQLPKYINSSDSLIYNKGDHLYGLYQARPRITKKRKVLLSEGYIDVLSMHQYGFDCACGVLGTSLTDRQAHRLASISKMVYLVFDGDEAGRKATLRSAKMLLGSGVGCRVVNIPEGEDADSILKSKGADFFEKLIKDSQDGIDFCTQTVSSFPSPLEASEWAISFLNNVKSLGLKASYIPKIAYGLGMTEAELRLALKDGTSSPEAANNFKRKTQLNIHQRDRELLIFAIQQPDYIRKMEKTGADFAFRTAQAKTLWEKVKNYTPSQIVNVLEESERQFYVQALMQGTPHLNVQDEWGEIKQFIDRCKAEQRLQYLTAALQRVQGSGDTDEENRLLNLYQEELLSRKTSEYNS